MSDGEITSTEGQESTQTQTTETTDTGSGAVHPAELRKAQKALKEAEKQKAELLAKIKEHEAAGLSEVEKLQARLRELEPTAATAAELQAWANERVTGALAALPKEAREKLESVVEGLPAPKAMALIEAVGLAQGNVVRAADVPRGAPKQPAKMPTLAQIESDPNALNNYSSEQLAGLLGQAGIKTTSGKVWG